MHFLRFTNKCGNTPPDCVNRLCHITHSGRPVSQTLLRFARCRHQEDGAAGSLLLLQSAARHAAALFARDALRARRAGDRGQRSTAIAAAIVTGRLCQVRAVARGAATAPGAARAANGQRQVRNSHDCSFKQLMVIVCGQSFCF